MTRHLLFAITLMGIGVFLNSSAQAVMSDARCEDQAANCVGRCANPGGGEYDNNRCMRSCERQVNRCLIRAHDAAWRR
jgi:hypothetical protein